MTNPTTFDNTRSHGLDWGLALIRTMIAVVFVYHGGQKLFGLFGGYGIEGTAGFFAKLGIPFPTLSVIAAGGAEFFGGLALLLGVGARLAAVPVAITMLVAALTAHGGSFSAQAGGMEYPLTLAIVAAGIALTGPGRFTLTALARARTRHGLEREAVTS